MNVVIVNFGEEPWFDPVLRCAVKFSGCHVTVVSDREENKDGASWIDIRDFHECKLVDSFAGVQANKERAVFEGQCIARWHIIREMWTTTPFVCLDRDELVFSDLKLALAPFLETHYACTFDGPTPRAPLLINDLNPLEAFCKQSLAMLQHGAPNLRTANDMTLWASCAQAFGWNVGNLCEVKNGSVFDNSIACADGYVVDDDTDAKMVEWRRNKPHFFTRQDEVVRANTIHLWGPHKRRISEFAGKAGV